MGILDKLRGSSSGQTSPNSNPEVKGASAEAAAKIRSILATKQAQIEAVSKLLLPHEKPVDILQLIQNPQQNKKEIKEEFGLNSTVYTVAVLPRQYDHPKYNDPKFGTNPDYWFDGDSYHSKRREEIVDSKASVRVPESTEFKPYYERKRYFVEVNGKLLPKASVYTFADGQVQIHSCDYDPQGRTVEFRNVIDGKLRGQVKKIYDEKLGHVSDYVENEYDQHGQLIKRIGFHVQKRMDTPNKTEWVEYQTIESRGEDGNWVKQSTREFSRSDNPKNLYINGWDLRLRRLAVPHPQDTAKEPYIGKPGYGV